METAVQREASMGTALALHPDLQPYIHNIDKVPGMAIMIDLYLPQNNKTRIISVYIPSSVSKHSNHAQKSIMNWIQNANSCQFNIIIMGDFNNNINNKKLPTRHLLNKLQENGLTSLLDFNDITEHTWSRDNSKSQIDDIWTSYSILLDISEPKLITTDESTKSDHKILSIEWNTGIYIATGCKKRSKRKIYMYDKTTNDNWTEFADDLTKKMNELQLQSPTIQDETQLNKYWNTWENLLRSSINKHIPYTYSAPRIFHSHSFKATQLHKALTLINKTIIKIKRPITPLTLEHFTNILNSNLQKIQDLSNLEVPTLQSWHLTPTNFRPTLQLLSTIQTTLLKARKLEHSQQKRDTINSFIERRYKNFTDNTTKIINSVLGRHTDRVTFDNIITPTEVITQPDQIKAVTRQHFKNWTRANLPNEEKWQEWEQAYTPLAGFDEKMYLEATTEIPYHEVLDTINKAPINKATGPSTISNEILKKLPTQGIKFLTAIFNACLELRKIPQKWRNSLVWPISKKTQYKGDLSQTRPITLIDHTRKILTKILTERLSKILLRHNILAPQNNVALPHTSTMIPIQQLNHIMEDAQSYNREFWILLQDMSKAYDTVHLPLLNKALNRIHVPLQLRELLINIFSDRKNQVITSIGKTQQYEVLDGIDQGETLSPILWRIYYDPLIHRIATQIKGYQMTTQIPYQPTTLTHNTSVIAFMDDTAWVALNKQEMEAITKLATSFYKMANIRVNPEKSILINNSDDTQNSSLKFQDQTINNIDRNEPFSLPGGMVLKRQK